MSRRLVSVLLVTVGSSVLVVGALSGCATAAPSAQAAGGSHHSTTAVTSAPPTSAAPTPTPTPTPTWPPTLPANALLQITATVTAPGGASANLVQTVWMPAPITAAQKTTLTAACPGEGVGSVGSPWLNNYKGAWVITTTMTATLNPGTTAWDNTKNGVLANFMGSADFTGAWSGFEAACSPGFIVIPGVQNAIAPIQGVNPSGQSYGWAGEFAGYGFYGGGNDPGSPDLGGNAVVSHCTVQLSSAAAAVPTAAAWATKVQKLSDGCDYDGAQEP
jgi:hypothetical protein